MAVDVFLAFSRDIQGIQLPAQSELTDKHIAANTPRSTDYFVETKEHQFGVQKQSTLTSASGGASGGKAALSELIVTKQVDQLTPHLLQICGLGAQFPQVTLYSRKAGGATKTQKPFLVHTLKQVYVKAVTWSINAQDEVPEETLTLAYGALKIEHWKQKATGDLISPPISGAWNQVENNANV